MSVVKELNYGLNKPISAQSSPEIVRYRSDNSEYRSGDTIRIEIGTGKSGLHLFPHSSYIEGKISCNIETTPETAINTACTARIDQSIYSIIKRMYLTHGSTQVEDIMYANRIYQACYDIQKNQYDRNGDTINLLVDESNKLNGKLFSFTKSTAANTGQSGNSSTYSFSFMLPSAILGVLAQKALFLGLMGASSLFLNIELETPNVVFTSIENVNSINYYIISDIYYNAKIAKLPSDVELSLINSLGNGRIIMPATTFKGELKTISQGDANFNDKFSFQLSSVKNFTFFVQNQGSANGRITSRSVTSRPALISEYFLSISGIAYPSQPIQGNTNIFMNTLRGWDMLNHTHGSGILSLSNYNNTTGTGADNTEIFGADNTTLTNIYRFVSSLDLDKFNHSSDIIISGTNTIGSSVNLNAILTANAPNALSLYGYAMHDIVYVIENGQIRVDM